MIFWFTAAAEALLLLPLAFVASWLARNTIRILGKGGGCIIGPSQEVMNDVPIANVRALVETIIEERQTVLDG